MIGKSSQLSGLRGILLLVGLILAGCANQAYRPAPLEPEASAQAFSQRRLDSHALAAFARALRAELAHWPPMRWGPSDLFTAALFYRFEFTVERARVRAAEAGVVTAQRRPPLGINLTSEYDSDPEESGASPFSIGAILDFVIPGPGQREARIDAAKARARAARGRLGQAVWAARERVYRRFLELQRLSRQTRLAKRTRQLLEQSVAMLTRRRRLGMAGSAAVTSMRLRLQRARLAQARVRSDLVGARIALARAVGVPAAAVDDIHEKLASPAADLPESPPAKALRTKALTGRYDMRRALARYAAADAELRAAVAEQFPDITLSPGLVFDQGSGVWVLDLSWLLTLPGYHEGPIAAARARRDAAAARFRALQARVIGDLSRALARYRGSLDILATAQDMLAAQREYLAQVRARVQGGYAGRLALLTARLETLAAKRARAEAQIAARMALVRLETTAQTNIGSGVEAQRIIERFVAGLEPSQHDGARQ